MYITFVPAKMSLRIIYRFAETFTAGTPSMVTFGKDDDNAHSAYRPGLSTMHDGLGVFSRRVR